MSQHIEYDRRTAELRDPMIGNQPEDRSRLYFAKANLRPTGGDHGPRIGPAGTMEHRQRPEIDAVESESAAAAVAKRREVGATMAVDDTLRITRGAGGVEQAKRLPFVGDSWPRERWICASKKRFIVARAQRRRRRVGSIDVDDDDLVINLLQRLPHQRRVVPIDYQNLGAPMREREGDICCIKPRVERIEYSTEHWHGKMGFDHFRNI